MHFDFVVAVLLYSIKYLTVTSQRSKRMWRHIRDTRYRCAQRVRPTAVRRERFLTKKHKISRLTQDLGSAACQPSSRSISLTSTPTQWAPCCNAPLLARGCVGSMAMCDRPTGHAVVVVCTALFYVIHALARNSNLLTSCRAATRLLPAKSGPACRYWKRVHGFAAGASRYGTELHAGDVGSLCLRTMLSSTGRRCVACRMKRRTCASTGISSLSLISAITTGASAATTTRIGRCVSGAYIGFYRARASLWARSTRGRARAASCRALSGSGIALLCLERRLDRSADEAS